MTTDPALSDGVLDAFLNTIVSLLQDIIQLLRDIVLIEYGGVSLTFFDLFFGLLILDFFYFVYVFVRR